MATTITPWTVTYHALAKGELLNLKKNHPKAFTAVCQTFDQLARESNPMQPGNPELDVCKMRHDAPGWFRIKVLNHTQWRVIFRLLQDHGDGQPLEVECEGFLDPTAKQRVIQITRVAHRSTVYEKLRGRQDRVYGLL